MFNKVKKPKLNNLKNNFNNRKVYEYEYNINKKFISSLRKSSKNNLSLNGSITTRDNSKKHSKSFISYISINDKITKSIFNKSYTKKDNKKEDNSILSKQNFILSKLNSQNKTINHKKINKSISSKNIRNINNLKNIEKNKKKEYDFYESLDNKNINDLLYENNKILKNNQNIIQQNNNYLLYNNYNNNNLTNINYQKDYFNDNNKILINPISARDNINKYEKNINKSNSIKNLNINSYSHFVPIKNKRKYYSNNSSFDHINSSSYLNSMEFIFSDIKENVFDKCKELLKEKENKKLQLEKSINSLKKTINLYKNKKKYWKKENSKVEMDINFLINKSDRLKKINYDIYIDQKNIPDNNFNKLSILKNETNLINQKIIYCKKELFLFKEKIQKLNNNIFDIKKENENMKESLQILKKHNIQLKEKIILFDKRHENVIENVKNLRNNSKLY